MNFLSRHLGVSDSQQKKMLQDLGFESMEAFLETVIPTQLRWNGSWDLPTARTESELLELVRTYAEQNKVFQSLMGMGYSATVTPSVIQRNILENPSWYTQYTPYQAEISQGRLEALLNFQTLVSELTGLPIANASLLDEGTAAAEAVTLCESVRTSAQEKKVFVHEDLHPQTRAVIDTRCEPLGIEVQAVKRPEDLTTHGFAVVFPYIASKGEILDVEAWQAKSQSNSLKSIWVCDPLALVLLPGPGAFGADIAVGSMQRFGVPMGFGGPHAAFFATTDALKRKVPGRIVGVSKDRDNQPAIRLALQTREQHIRREKATSNICTAQVLLAIMASMYAVYHGREGLEEIALDVHSKARALAKALKAQGHKVLFESFFDTFSVELKGISSEDLFEKALSKGILIRVIDPKTISISIGEGISNKVLEDLLGLMGSEPALSIDRSDTSLKLRRKDEILTHPVFSLYRTETEMMRYVKRLERKDLSLTDSMIPLGSCTMKLNAATEMMALSMPEWSALHPFQPLESAKGYLQVIQDLERDLAEVTGFSGVSLQPNAGSQGEYAGLLVIRKFHQARGEGQRTICLIPTSAHGTNPASATMAGLKVVAVACDSQGNIDLNDLDQKIETHGKNIAALMVTYPSTHGVFEKDIQTICSRVKAVGGHVYMDGANMNAQLGLTRPAELGADVCHLNLHKTFCIPHGGGGPGVGPIACTAELKPYLPGHPVVKVGGEQGVGAIASAPWGSASILTISWAYVRMVGAEGLRRSAEVAILNANWIASRLQEAYPVVFTGEQGKVAHECIIDLRPFKKYGIEVEDVAKRLMDYGFHAPTMSWPVAGTLMIEPTESESPQELERFCDAMLSIRQEIERVVTGEWSRENNPLKNAPHTLRDLTEAEWKYPYDRVTAVYPRAWVQERKFWPAVSRVDNAYGDRNVVCTCPPMSDYDSVTS